MKEITAVLVCTLSGTMLAPQIIYQGKTDKKCHPKFWHITHSENHWSNSETMTPYVENILFPYVESVREMLPLSQSNQTALCVFDILTAHRTDEFKTALHNAIIKFRFVPASCTGELQPLDISGKNELKCSLKFEFQKWYAAEVDKTLKAGGTIDSINIDLKLKPLHAGWMVTAMESIQSEIIKLGWDKSGIDYVNQQFKLLF